MHEIGDQTTAFRTLLEGVLRLWDADLAVLFEPFDEHAPPVADTEIARDGPDPGTARCRISRDGTTIASVDLVASPLGRAWRVEVGGKRARTHLSAAAALRHLRDGLCADRPAGRVLFVASDGDGSGP